MESPFAYLQEAVGLNVFAVLFAAVMAFLIFALPRRYALLPFLLTCFYMTLGQVVLIFGFHFTMFRVLIFIGWARILLRGEHLGIRWTSLDRIFLWWVAISFIMGTILTPTFEGVQNRLGFTYNALGSFFFVRCMVRDWEDWLTLVRGLAVIFVPLALSMIVEKFTHQNAFAVFGGVPPETFERDGSLRCQGPFAHPILAGTMGATTFPLLAGVWWGASNPRDRLLALIGMVSSVLVVFASASSGPLGAWIISIIALALWRFRFQMSLVRKGVVWGLLVLQLFMKSPVWYIFGKLSVISGGTGWHRAMVIDQAIYHFNEWWLKGTAVTAHWDEASILPLDPDNIDITNQYVIEGISGGLIKMILFIAVIVSCYRMIGYLLKSLEGVSYERQMLVWGMGCAFTAHVVSFLSVSYFDQTVVIYYTLPTIIASLAASMQESSTKDTATALEPALAS
jgi:hypothetical protein